MQLQGFMGMEKASLVEWATDNETAEFRRSSLEDAVINWNMKYDKRWEVNHKCI